MYCVSNIKIKKNYVIKIIYIIIKIFEYNFKYNKKHDKYF